MTATGKCPKCENVVTHASYDEIEVGKLTGQTYRGFTIFCPHCATILGAGFDHVPIERDTVEAALKGRTLRG